MRGALPKSLKEADLNGKSVLVRGDFDVDDGHNPRADSIRELVKMLMDKSAGVIRVIGHSETNYDLAAQLKSEFPNVGFDAGLRKDPREKANDMGFAEELAEDWDVFVNEAFATSHRKHASILMLPQVFKRDNREVYLGPRFERELERLGEVWDTPGERILVIGGVKVDDKAEFAINMAEKFEYVLTGGKLPEFLNTKSEILNSRQIPNSKFKLANLREDGLDIADEAIVEYCRIISEAEVILAAGVMGKYEDDSSSAGTRKVLQAIADNTKAYKVAGGGDIEMAISTYGLTDKFNWISVGGGAMLVYLGTGTLPGLEAITN